MALKGALPGEKLLFGELITAERFLQESLEVSRETVARLGELS